MWVVQAIDESGADPWEVGYFKPAGEWCGWESFRNSKEAARLCNYLNGGAGKRYPDRLDS